MSGSDEPWTFRHATLDDLPLLQTLVDDPASVHRRTDCLHRRLPESPTQLKQRLQFDQNLLLIHSEQPAGFASWQWFDRHAHLNVMVVSGALQRQGLGQRLFLAWRDHIRTVGANSLSLRAYRDSDWAIAFYTKLGLSRWGDASSLLPAGVHQYVETAKRHAQWPDPDKVLFFSLV